MYNLKINSTFLYYLRPEKAMLIALLFFFFLLLIAPIRIINTLNLTSAVYLVISLLSFILGTKLIKSNKYKKVVLSINIEKSRVIRVYNVACVLGLIGVGFKYIDLLFVRGMSFSNTTMDNFDLAVEGGGNILSIISAFLIFFAYVPFTLDLVFEGLHKKKIKVLTFLLILSTAIVSLLTGSRNAIMIPLLYGVIVFLYSKQINLSFKWCIVLILGAFVALNIIGLLFIKRLDEMNLTGAMAVVSKTGGYSDKVPANQNFIRLLENNEGKFYYPSLFAYSNVCQYFTHSVFEFPVVKDYIDNKDIYLYGRSTFAVYFKLIDKLLGGDISDDEEYNARPGIWSTFFYNWYLDFGWYGIFGIFWLGFFCKYIWSKVYVKGNVFYLPLVIFLFIIVLFILQINMIAGSGAYALFSFLLLPRLCKLKYFRYLNN